MKKEQRDEMSQRKRKTGTDMSRQTKDGERHTQSQSSKETKQAVREWGSERKRVREGEREKERDRERETMRG